MTNRIYITGILGGLGTELSNILKKSYPVYGSSRETGNLIDYSTLSKILFDVMNHDINIFINNAAIYLNKPFENYSLFDIDTLINTNLTSQIKLIQLVYKYFQSKSNCKIININSISCKNLGKNESLYAVSKSAMSILLNSLQLETKNIKFLDIYVGAMKTKMSKHRSNYDTLIDPVEVALLIDSLLKTNLTTCFPTELVIRRYNESYSQ